MFAQTAVYNNNNNNTNNNNSNNNIIAVIVLQQYLNVTAVGSTGNNELGFMKSFINHNITQTFSRNSNKTFIEDKMYRD